MGQGGFEVCRLPEEYRSERLMYMFFELIQVALGNRECLSREEWHEVYDICQQQAVAGFVSPVIDGCKYTY